MLVAEQLTLTGTVLESASPGYDEARTIWNGAIDRRPAVIARCLTADDVAVAVRFARASDLEISVRGGGHAVAGHAVVDDGLMIDLSRMRGSPSTQVPVSRASNRVSCSASSTAPRRSTRWPCPAGIVSHTGVAGLTLGGGVGWLSAGTALTIDNLLGSSSSRPHGELVRTSADENADLFWAATRRRRELRRRHRVRLPAARGRAGGDRRHARLSVRAGRRGDPRCARRACRRAGRADDGARAPHRAAARAVPCRPLGQEGRRDRAGVRR